MKHSNNFQSSSPAILGYTWEGHQNFDTGSRGGTHANPTKARVRRAFRKRNRRWKAEE